MGIGLGTGRPIQPVSTPSDTRMRREMSARERGPKLSTWRVWGSERNVNKPCKAWQGIAEMQCGQGRGACVYQGTPQQVAAVGTFTLYLSWQGSCTFEPQAKAVKKVAQTPAYSLRMRMCRCASD